MTSEPAAGTALPVLAALLSGDPIPSGDRAALYERAADLVPAAARRGAFEALRTVVKAARRDALAGAAAPALRRAALRVLDALQRGETAEILADAAATGVGADRTTSADLEALLAASGAAAVWALAARARALPPDAAQALRELALRQGADVWRRVLADAATRSQAAISAVLPTAARLPLPLARELGRALLAHPDRRVTHAALDFLLALAPHDADWAACVAQALRGNDADAALIARSALLRAPRPETTLLALAVDPALPCPAGGRQLAELRALLEAREARRVIRDAVTPLLAFARAVAQVYDARRLYPAGHPQRRRTEIALETLWAAAFGPAPTITFDFRDELVRTEGMRAERIVGAAFRGLVLAARAADALRVELAAAAGPAGALQAIDALARGLVPGSAPAAALAAAGAASAAPRTEAPERASIETLARVWRGVIDERRVDERDLAALVRAVARRPGDGTSLPVELVHVEDEASALVAHALNTARLVYLAVRAGALGVGELAESVIAALLADVGMATLPADVVHYPGRLAPTHFRLIREHPWTGARLLLATPQVTELAGVVAFEHHVRPDGQGYPQTAAGWTLSPVARIFQAADAYAALRCPRRFRPASDEAQARVLLRRAAGTRLDAETVEFLIERAVPAGCAVRVIDALVPAE